MLNFQSSPKTQNRSFIANNKIQYNFVLHIYEIRIGNNMVQIPTVFHIRYYNRFPGIFRHDKMKRAGVQQFYKKNCT